MNNLKQMSVGKHKGKAIALVVLKEADYIKWLLETDVSGSLATDKQEVKHLISIFDSKPIQAKCCGSKCSNLATRFTGYVGNPDLIYPWCDTCDVEQQGAGRHKLTQIHTYEGALHYVTYDCGGNKKDYKSVIRTIALAKGLPKRCGENQAKLFFS